MPAKVISEHKSVSRVRIFRETDPNTGCMYSVHLKVWLNLMSSKLCYQGKP